MQSKIKWQKSKEIKGDRFIYSFTPDCIADVVGGFKRNKGVKFIYFITPRLCQTQSGVFVFNDF